MRSWAPRVGAARASGPPRRSAWRKTSAPGGITLRRHGRATVATDPSAAANMIGVPDSVKESRCRDRFASVASFAYDLLPAGTRDSGTGRGACAGAARSVDGEMTVTHSRKPIASLTVLVALAVACTSDAPDGPGAAGGPDPAARDESRSTRNAYFGDVHVHTKYSFDAYIFGTRADPDDAYRFAKGEPLTHAAGIEMRLKAPLDFLAVADHATYLGMFEQMDNPDSSVGQHSLSVALRNAATPADRSAVFQEVLPRERGYVDSDDLLDLAVVRSAWRKIVEAAERHNDPGNFTTFIGYEFTAGGRRGENLHRNVIFRDSNVPRHSVQPTGRKEQPGAAVGLDGRAARSGHRLPGDPAQLERLGRVDVPAHRPGGQPDRPGLRRTAHAQRAAGGGHAGQGNFRHASAPVPQRRVGGLRDHGADDRQRQPESTAGQLRP